MHPNRIEVKEDVKKPKSEFLQDLDSGPSTTEYEHNGKMWVLDLFTQGISRNFDGNNGFSGLGSNCIEHLKDDYDRKSVLAIPVLPSYYNDYSNETDEEQRTSQIKDSIRVINSALSFTDLAESSSLFRAIMYNAILASALDTITLKYRLREGHYSLSDLCADLNLHNRKLAAASLCLLFRFNEGADLIECLDNWDGPLTQSITPRCTIGTRSNDATYHFTWNPEDRLQKTAR
ncbi:mitochondrial distribution regulator misato [Holotrichia oblita]|uniref:Mitochondrial distribution regulator misato n=1 Tax=Holotrichia oblita TaxID=644536 RepID=A0ACB9TJA1_HOLOL|nr:mitochondrial distribution regulator misato [Holotrichia oblita]